jgi:cell division septation protein DedD
MNLSTPTGGFLLFCWLVFASSTPLSADSNIEFLYADLHEVQTIAHNEGKPYLLFFAANWCMPWQWMADHTLTNPALVDYTNTHYIATKIDIDQSKGKKIQADFGVKAIPTILVFSADGRLIAKVETALEAPELLELLQLHNIPANRLSAASPVAGNLLPTPQPNVAIARPALVPQSDMPVANTDSNDQYSIFDNQYSSDNAANQPINNSTSQQFNHPITPSSSNPVIPTQNPKPKTQNSPLSTREVFSIQIGAFSVYDNAVATAQDLKFEIGTNIQVISEERSTGTIFKLFVGHFASEAEANAFKTKLKRQAISGFVKKIYI